MKLKISDNPTDLAKIEEALQRVNGQATSHTYNSASDILAIAKEAEERLDQLGLPKKDRAGAVAKKASGGKMPKSYKFRRAATMVEMTRGSRDWYLTYVLRTKIFPDNRCGHLSMMLTQEQDKIAVESFRENYHVLAPSATASDMGAAA